MGQNRAYCAGLVLGGKDFLGRKGELIAASQTNLETQKHPRAASAAVHSETGTFDYTTAIEARPQLGVPESVSVGADQCPEWSMSRTRSSFCGGSV
jgi:hypothetical protein